MRRRAVPPVAASAVIRISSPVAPVARVALPSPRLITPPGTIPGCDITTPNPVGVVDAPIPTRTPTPTVQATSIATMACVTAMAVPLPIVMTVAFDFEAVHAYS